MACGNILSQTPLAFFIYVSRYNKKHYLLHASLLQPLNQHFSPALPGEKWPFAQRCIVNREGNLACLAPKQAASRQHQDDHHSFHASKIRNEKADTAVNRICPQMHTRNA